MYLLIIVLREEINFMFRFKNINCRLFNRNRNRNRKLDISTAPTKAKSREPAYSQPRRLIKTESIGRGVKSRESGRQTVRRLRWVMLRVEMAREVRGREGIGIGFVKEQCFQF